MRKAEDIYEESVSEVLEAGSQSLKAMALLAIDKARHEMFQFLYDKIGENKGMSLEDFFDKMDMELDFP